MSAFLLTAVCFTVLALFWQMLNWVFDLIARAQRTEDAKATEGKVT